MRFSSMRFTSMLIVSVLAIGACTAKEAEPEAVTSALRVQNAWARSADSGAMTAMYFTLANDGAVADTLNGVVTTEAAAVTLHVSTQRDGMMHMSEVRALPVPAMDSVSFRPLGAHVMLTGLQRPLVAGDTVTATLTFVSGATLRVRAGVRQP